MFNESASRRVAAPRFSGRRDDLAQTAALDLVDEAAHAVPMGQEGMLADSRDRPADGLVDVVESAELVGGSRPVSAAIAARRPASSMSCNPQPVWCIKMTSRVCNSRCESTSERSTSSRHQAARVAQDMRFAGVETEDPEVVDARVHAGHDRDVARRNEGARPFEIGLVDAGIFDQFVDDVGHVSRRPSRRR